MNPPEQMTAISWQERVLNQIDRLKLTIPFDSVRNRPGVAMVQVTIDRKGNVIDATLDKGSGNAQIDLASLKLIKTASPFPEPPLSVDGRLIILKIEVDFTTLPPGP